MSIGIRKEKFCPPFPITFLTIWSVLFFFGWKEEREGYKPNKKKRSWIDLRKGKLCSHFYMTFQINEPYFSSTSGKQRENETSQIKQSPELSINKWETRLHWRKGKLRSPSPMTSLINWGALFFPLRTERKKRGKETRQTKQLSPIPLNRRGAR